AFRILGLMAETNRGRSGMAGESLAPAGQLLGQTGGHRCPSMTRALPGQRMGRPAQCEMTSTAAMRGGVGPTVSRTTKGRSSAPCPKNSALVSRKSHGLTVDTGRIVTDLWTVTEPTRAYFMAKTHLRLIAPTTVKQTVGPQRRPNSDYRTHEHLTEAEIEKLIAATKNNRYSQRDATMILVAYRHGLPASELVTLRWDQIDFDAGILHVTRRKRGTPSTHPISGDELRALRRLKRDAKPSPFVFVSERGSPFSVAGFQKLIARA